MHGTLDHFDWNVARIDDLRRMIDARYSASQAAFALGITRGSAVGKAFRLGLRFNSPSAQNSVRGEIRPRAANPEARVRIRRPIKSVPEMAPEPAALYLPLISLGNNDCRYPVTADHPFLFCGNPKAEGSSYCAHHHHRCWTPPGSHRRDPRPR